MKAVVRLFVTLIVLAGLAGAGAYGALRWELSRPGPSDADVIVELPRGSGAAAIAARLEAAGVVRYAEVFRVAVRALGQERRMQAGEYAIPAAASLGEVIDLIVDGTVIAHAVTLPEGRTSAMAIEIVAASAVLTGEAPDAPPEGALLPETYMVTRGASRADVIARMAAAHDEVLARLWADRADDLPIDTPEEAVILASVVEKETALAEERPRVAAVFVNRLRRGMRLESDPTIIYGITEGYPLGRGIRRSELNDASNRYNTYRNDGLPPTPICNPGEASLAAVLNPPDTNDLFFVADGTGGHVFSETYAEHSANVRRWRQIERERREQAGR